MSQNEIINADILLEFIEIALHSILYYRKLYCDEIFIKKKIYGITANISQHPELNAYIRNTLVCIKELLQKDENRLKSINLIYLNENNIPIEKFTFHLDQLQTHLSEGDPYFIKIEEALRYLCLKLSMSETYLEPLPINSSFVINIVTNHAAHVNFLENCKCHVFPWIISSNSKEVQNGLLLPIRSLEIDYLVLQCYATEDKKSKLSNA